MECFAF